MSIFGGGYSNQTSNSGGGFGCAPRVLIGLVVAGIGIISYFTHTEVNPMTGEKQHIALSTDQEIALGLQSAPQMEQQMGGSVDAGDPRSKEVSKIGWQIVRDSPEISNSAYASDFHFTLLADSQTINAFSLPGGQVFITAALYSRLENEGELAGVLGHEIGHVMARHVAQQMAAGNLGQSLTMAVGIGASDDRGHGQMAAAAAAMANQMLQLKFSRTDELQADSLGMKFMAEAGFDPTEMRHVMEILKQAVGNSSSQIFATHPNPDNRIEQINAILQKDYPGGVPGNLTKGGSL